MSTRTFSRQSTINELAETLPGKGLKAMILKGLPKTETAKERQELEEMTLGLPLETVVEFSEGKLPWGLADSVVDLANRRPDKVALRTVGAGLQVGATVLGAVAKKIRG